MTERLDLFAVSLRVGARSRQREHEMPYSSLQSSPLVDRISPVKIYYRDEGEGLPLLFLHGGWGYGIYPFNRQIGALRDEYRMIIPDRGGYGRSTRILRDLPPDFHYRA